MPVHTLNGTAVTGRHIIALLENGQREDGTVRIPETLVAAGRARHAGPHAGLSRAASG